MGTEDSRCRPSVNRRLPKREGLLDDFVQLGFRFAAAEGEAAGEMLQIISRQAVEFAGDEGFQGRAFRHVARVFQQLGGGLGQFLFLRGGNLVVSIFCIIFWKVFEAFLGKPFQPSRLG